MNINSHLILIILKNLIYYIKKYHIIINQFYYLDFII